MAIRDESPLIVPYPADYFKLKEAQEHEGIESKPH